MATVFYHGWLCEIPWTIAVSQGSPDQLVGWRLLRVDLGIYCSVSPICKSKKKIEKEHGKALMQVLWNINIQFAERSNQSLVLGSQKYHFSRKTCYRLLKLMLKLFSDKDMPDCGDNLLVASLLLGCTSRDPRIFHEFHHVQWHK
jgi:hypothetical protein